MTLVIRRLALDEMDAAALLHRASFDERLPWLAGLHTPAEDRAFFREQVFPHAVVHGAFEEGALRGILVLREDWIDQLYVAPGQQGRGIGSRLIACAKEASPVLQLWTFQRNEGARRFYERHGFVALEARDGRDNEEREPDIRYRWEARAWN
jgi:GNAT superfamily N-acetyltransferase